MAISYSFSMQNNSDSIKDAKDETIHKILEMWGLYAENEAKENITEEGRVNTGALRNSITHQVEMGEESVYIGSNLEYAIYNEVGTGVFYPGGRQTPWAFQDKDGNWIWTHGMKGIHFLKNAIENNTDTYNAMAEQELKAGN